MKDYLHRICMVVMFLLLPAWGFSHEVVISIDSIDKLYVTDAEAALRHIGTLRSHCEASGWKSCSQVHLEAVESLIYLRKGDHHNAQKHAYAALAAPRDDDKTWRLIAYQSLCESFYATGNYALQGKYAMMMSLEADQPTFSALAHIYEAQALGHTDNPRRALAKADSALFIMEQSHPETENEQFNALLLYYFSLDTKIQICREAGMPEEAYDYAMQFLDRLAQEERQGGNGMDVNGFKTERLNNYLRLANICLDLGKDGNMWFEKGMVLYRELVHSVDVTCEVADYLFNTRRYDDYERIVVPALENCVKERPTKFAMHMLWQWVHILAVNGRRDEAFGWTMKGMEMGDRLAGYADRNAGTDFLMAYESELKNIAIEAQQAELEANRLRLVIIASLAFLIAAGLVLTLVLWRRQKHNIDFLYRQMEENRQKERRAEEQMFSVTRSSVVLDGKNKEDEADVALLAKLQAFLKENDRFRDSDLTMEQIARQLAVRQKKLNASLQVLKGTTLVGYVRDMRLEYACALLRDCPDMKVETVAMQAGYSTPRQFMRIFKDKYNLTPSEYRNASRQRK